MKRRPIEDFPHSVSFSLSCDNCGNMLAPKKISCTLVDCLEGCVI